MPRSQLSRRHLLMWGASLPVAAALAGCAHGVTPLQGPKLRVLAISDLHSSYGRIAQLLTSLRGEVASSDVPHLIVVNGDSFEKGNVVSVRSEGVIDWAFMAELPKIAPTVFNLGNHDNDLVYDLHPVVARMQSMGLTVLSNLIDKRTGGAYAPSSAVVQVGSHKVRMVGMATPSLSSYPAQSHDWLSIPDPMTWASEHFATLLAGDEFKLVLSHVGVVEERNYLPLVPEGGLMIGGHNHLLFNHQEGTKGYMHPGSWGAAYCVGEYGADGIVRTSIKAVEGAADPELQMLVDATMAAHLTASERATIGYNADALSLGDTGRGVSKGFADVAGADWGFIGHTTLGTGLKSGAIDQFHFDEVVRFDGRLMVAEIDASRMPAILKLCNQDRPMPMQEMTGDFIYAAERTGGAPRAGMIKLVTTDFCARNQRKYFGTTDLVFVDVPSEGVKVVARKALLS